MKNNPLEWLESTVDNLDGIREGDSAEIKGQKGAFTTRDFLKGETVYSFKKGIVVNEAELNKLPVEIRNNFIDKVGLDQFEIVVSPVCYVNHSCDPNCKEEGRIATALRPIKKGEEITIDYDGIVHLQKPMKCQCGSNNCRGIIYGAKKQPMV